MVWERTCGKRGNCWLYDQDKFRYFLHGSAFAFMMIGSLFDFGIIFMSNRIKNFYEDPEGDDHDKGRRISEIHMSAFGMGGPENDITIIDQTLVQSIDENSEDSAENNNKNRV